MSARLDMLVAVLAVRTGLVDAVAFADACLARGDERLTDHFVECGALRASDRGPLEQLARRLLADADPPCPAFATVAPQEQRSTDRYVYLDAAGQGGMGRVFRVHDTRLDRDVALKEMLPERAADEAGRDRFLREARITGQLQHPGIVPIYDLLPANGSGSPRYTMRLIPGRTLREAIQALHEQRRAGNDISLGRASLLQAFVSVCHTMAYAHSRRVIHRDLKPDNIRLGEYGEAIVLDWGLAKRLGASPSDESDPNHPTMPGQVVGTPAYMSPEQATGDVANVDHRSDIYGLGAILYAVLTGGPPFAGSLTEVLRRVLHEPPPAMRERCADVPPGLEAICLKALARFPEDRYQDARDLAEAVQQWQESERLEAERALRASEARYRSLIELMPQHVWTARPDGRLDYANQRGREVHGVGVEEYGGDSWQQLVHPDDLPGCLRRWRHSLQTGEPYECEFRVCDATGWWGGERPDPSRLDYRWILSRAIPVRDEAGRIESWCGTNTDIHTLKQAQQERDDALARLRVSEERYRLLIELMPQSVWTATPDGSLDFVNKGRGTLRGDAWLQAIHPDDRPEAARRWHHSLATGEPYECEFRVCDTRTWQGSLLEAGPPTYHWYLSRAVPVRDGRGRIGSWFGTSTDIHALKQFQQERDEALQCLQTLEAEHRRILDGIPHIVWTSGAAGGNSFLNRRWYDYTGLSPEESAGADRWLKALHPDDQPRLHEAWAHSLATGEPFRIEYRLRDRHGGYHWFLGLGESVRDEQGHIVRWFGSCTAIAGRDGGPG